LNLTIFSFFKYFISKQSLHLQALWNHIFNRVLQPLKIHEFYSVDVDDTVKKFRKFVQSSAVPQAKSTSAVRLKILQDEEYRRNKSTIDFSSALELFNQPL